MAEFTGTISPGDIDEVYSRTAIDLGTRIKDTDGNEYIFLKGVASTVKYSWVVYDEESETALLTTTSVGPVAVAQAAIVADKYGWYCIYGKTLGCAVCDTTALADNTIAIGRTGTDGYVGIGPAGGDILYGAICRSAMEAATGNTTTLFQIFYPWTDQQTAGH